MIGLLIAAAIWIAVAVVLALAIGAAVRQTDEARERASRDRRTADAKARLLAELEAEHEILAGRRDERP